MKEPMEYVAEFDSLDKLQRLASREASDTTKARLWALSQELYNLTHNAALLGYSLNELASISLESCEKE
jgi:hypothetical protein